MKVLVTGGAGFLGSHVADALTESGHEVTVFDIRESPYISDGQKMVVGDLLDEEALNHVVSGQEAVYHFAGIADIDECATRPVDTAKYNILGTVQLLEACRKVDTGRFVFASSAYVYSDSGSFYRASKQACEAFIENYQQLYGLKFTCIRYGSLYGDRADSRNSIYNLITQAIAKGKITYRGTGDELREYIHVRDAAQISAAILDPEYENQHLIITGLEKMRYGDLLDMIREMLNNEVEIEILPSERKAHYRITPYNFSPKLGKKIVNNTHIDMGQGLLQCMAEIYEKIHGEKHREMGLFVNGTSGV